MKQSVFQTAVEDAIYSAMAQDNPSLALSSFPSLLLAEANIAGEPLREYHEAAMRVEKWMGEKKEQHGSTQS